MNPDIIKKTTTPARPKKYNENPSGASSNSILRGAKWLMQTKAAAMPRRMSSVVMRCDRDPGCGFAAGIVILSVARSIGDWVENKV